MNSPSIDAAGEGADETLGRKQRLAIIGCGSSGLITLKYALEAMPDWDVVAFEKSGSIVGCWGRPPNGFVSTSTKYATQFACFEKYDAEMHRSEANPFADYFQDDEYGRYLEDFANAFSLRPHIVCNCDVESISRTDDGNWKIIRRVEGRLVEEWFNRVIICTGLVDQPKEVVDCSVPVLRSVRDASSVQGKTVVVTGGGESAVDVAQRLAKPELQNSVYLSLRSGVRVSPRYHPIRDVPSDFLRNRLLLANHPDVRNAIGQKFVEFRISASEWLRRWFPASGERQGSGKKQDCDGKSAATAVRKDWDRRLTGAAKGQLFNVYHNKSDDFLNAVASGHMQIIGASVDDDCRRYYEFQSEQQIEIEPDLIVPAIGYRSTLPKLFDSTESVLLDQFYLGCMHARYQNLGAVGFCRPIIGNIPSISEMQARYVCGMMAAHFQRPADIDARHASYRKKLVQQFCKLDTDAVYPVEMFPYCDQLAVEMDCYPSPGRIGSLLRWWRMMRAPATTMHYFEEKWPTVTASEQPVHSPWLITGLLLLAKPIDLGYRAFRWMLR